MVGGDGLLCPTSAMQMKQWAGAHSTSRRAQSCLRDGFLSVAVVVLPRRAVAYTAAREQETRTGAVAWSVALSAATNCRPESADGPRDVPPLFSHSNVGAGIQPDRRGVTNGGRNTHAEGKSLTRKKEMK